MAYRFLPKGDAREVDVELGRLEVGVSGARHDRHRRIACGGSPIRRRAAFFEALGFRFSRDI